MPGTPLRYNRLAYNWKLASLVHARRDMPLSAVCLDLIVAHPVPSEREPALREPPCLRMSAGNANDKERQTRQPVIKRRSAEIQHHQITLITQHARVGKNLLVFRINPIEH